MDTLRRNLWRSWSASSGRHPTRGTSSSTRSVAVQPRSSPQRNYPETGGGGGADLSDLAVKLVKQRIKREFGGLLFDVIHRTDFPKRTDQGKLPHYRSHAHRLYGEQEGVCKACRTHFPFRVMQVDHRVPQAHGGGDEYDNLQMLCSGCNARKGTGTHEELLAKLREDGILEK